MTTETIPKTLAERAIAFIENEEAKKKAEQLDRRHRYIADTEARFLNEFEEVFGSIIPHYSMAVHDTDVPDRPDVIIDCSFDGVDFVYAKQYLRAVKNCPACGAEIRSVALSKGNLLYAIGTFLTQNDAIGYHVCAKAMGIRP